MGEGSKKYFFKKGKKHDFSIFEIWMLQKWIEIMDLILVFFVGFPNIPNFDVSKYFSCTFFMSSLIRKSHGPSLVGAFLRRFNDTSSRYLLQQDEHKLMWQQELGISCSALLLYCELQRSGVF